MPFPKYRPLRALAFAGLASIIAGCQSYQPRLLDLAAHRDAWLARSPHDDPVQTLAARMAESPGDIGFEPSDGIGLAEGEVIALVYNPHLRMARLGAGVARATAAHAGLWDDPEFSVDILRVTESVANPWLISPGLALTIPLSGRIEAEEAGANAALRAELLRVEEAEWMTRVELRRAWLRWSAALLRAEQTARLLESIESLVGSTSALADAGEMSRPEAALFAIERSTQARMLARYRGEAAVAVQQIRMIMGLSPDAPLELVATRLNAGRIEHDSEDTIAEHNLSISRLREEYDAAEQSLLAETRKQYPDLTIGPQYESDQGQSRIGMLGAIPIPILNANRQGIAEAEARRELARAAFEVEYERLAGSLAVARAHHGSLHQQRLLLEQEVAPQVDRQYADARRLLELGEGGGLLLLESLTRVGQAQVELIDARLDESLAAIEIEALLGPAREVDHDALRTTGNLDSAADGAAEHSKEVSP